MEKHSEYRQGSPCSRCTGIVVGASECGDLLCANCLKLTKQASSADNIEIKNMADLEQISDLKDTLNR